MAEFDVFLSHNSADKPWVSRLKEDLGRYGLRVWLDRDEIRPGDLFAKALEQGLGSSKAMALVVSPEAMGSGWVEREYYRALTLATDKQIRLQLIPVMLREAELPGFLQDLNWVDFRVAERYAESVAKLVWGIRGKKPRKVLELSAPVIEPLAALPEDIVPPVGMLPGGSRMPYRPNPVFVGREEELKELARVLKVGGRRRLGRLRRRRGWEGLARPS